MNQPIPQDNLSQESSHMIEHYLSAIFKKLPVVNQIITQYGNTTLAEYIQTLIPRTIPTYQPRDDLFEAIYHYVAPLLGESIAKHAARDLDAHPVALTANHHGVEFFSQTFQARLIFGLNAIRNIHPIKTIPVFSVGNIPLNNFIYPRGILLYHDEPNKLDRLPMKLPIFPDRLKRQMVSVTDAFDKKMIDRAESQFNKRQRKKHFSPSYVKALHKILHKDYCDTSVLSQTSYSHQSVILNNRIWKRLFSQKTEMPEVIYLEIEKIVNALLENDLQNADSLVWQVMFHPELRKNVLHELDGIRACWESRKLAQRLQVNLAGESQRSHIPGGGTIFFWGIDHAKRRIPLHLETKASGDSILCGIDDFGNLWEIPFTHPEILHRLREHTLLPSLFICFLAISFARGLTCVGGYFQCEYLPIMQEGLITALQNTSGYENVAQIVAHVSTNSYLDSMVAIMTKITDHSLIPAGPVEIIAGGGISNKELEQIASLTVRDAHLADMFDTVLDAVPLELLPLGWRKQLAADSFQLLQGKVIIK